MMPIEAEWEINRNGYLEIEWKLGPEALEFIQGVGEIQLFNAGDRIVSQHEQGDAMFLIIEGSVDVIRDIGVGQQFLAKLERNRSFGEVALLTNSPRTASVTAQTKVRVIKITKENLAHLSAENPRIAMQIYRILAESLAQSLRQTGTIPSQLR
ncbi:cyclic nucleotide-binding domain-containing protein [bacterium]|nr:cyclic nucleotide-binding domain-containing protein [bacterium]